MADASGHDSPDGTLRELLQTNLLECKVCFENFSVLPRGGRRPQTLPCGHVLCLECVGALTGRPPAPSPDKLACPFCRQLCDVDSTSPCQVLADLQELLLCRNPGPPLAHRREEPGPIVGGLCSESLSLRSAFGGWGALINPTGIAAFGSSGTTAVVVHDGDQRVVVFGPQGQRLHGFGRRGRGQEGEICYPADVAVTPNGYVVVTDPGDGAVKIFTTRGSPVLTIKDGFQLPWGVDVDDRGHVMVTDLLAGTLSRVTVDFGRGVALRTERGVTGLRRPKSVACCRVTGNVAVVEQLDPSSQPPRCQHARLRVYNKDFDLLCQTDSFSLSLVSMATLCVSSVAFDRNGDVIVIDAQQGMIWSLGTLHRGPILTPLVREGLVRPVALVCTAENSLVVLDAGDHAVKIYSAAKM